MRIIKIQPVIFKSENSKIYLFIEGKLNDFRFFYDISFKKDKLNKCIDKIE